MTRTDLERKAADLQAEIKSRRECGHNTYIIENCLEHIIDELISMYPKKPRQGVDGARRESK